MKQPYNTVYNTVLYKPRHVNSQDSNTNANGGVVGIIQTEQVLCPVADPRGANPATAYTVVKLVKLVAPDVRL